MNPEHIELCSSEGWRDMLRELIMPWALGTADLGDDVLEVGPGPGMTTGLLAGRVVALTAVEIDAVLAARLADHFTGTNVDVVHADATDLPFEDGRFTGAVSFTMLHHVPSAELQDRLFTEVARVLRPGGLFIASDSVASDELAALHHDDIYNPVDPTGLEARFTASGFDSTVVKVNDFGWAVTAHRTM